MGFKPGTPKCRLNSKHSEKNYFGVKSVFDNYKENIKYKCNVTLQYLSDQIESLNM